MATQISDTVYICTNCLWRGTPSEMKESGDPHYHWCPDCSAEFDSEDPDMSPAWKVYDPEDWDFQNKEEWPDE